MKYSPTASGIDPVVYGELQRVSALFSFVISDALQVMHRPTAKFKDGQVAIQDGVDWNPAGTGTKSPIWFDADTNTWKAMGGGGGGGGTVAQIQPGHGIKVDVTDPANPIVSVDLAANYSWTGQHTFNAGIAVGGTALALTSNTMLMDSNGPYGLRILTVGGSSAPGTLKGFTIAAISFDAVNYREAFNVVPSGAGSIARMDYGNTGDKPLHNMFGVLNIYSPPLAAWSQYGLGLSANGAVGIKWEIPDGPVDGKRWTSYVTPTNFSIAAENDASNIGSNFIVVTRAALRITDIQHGNPTDKPNQRFFGHNQMGWIDGGGPAGSNISSIEVLNNGGIGDSALATISFHCTGQYGTHIGLRNDGIFTFGGWSAPAHRFYINLGSGSTYAAGISYATGGFNTAGQTYAAILLAGVGADPNWAGVKSAGSVYNLMIGAAGGAGVTPQSIGWYREGSGWLWEFEGATLVAGTVPYARLSGVGNAATCNVVDCNGTTAAGCVPYIPADYLNLYYPRITNGDSEYPVFAQMFVCGGAGDSHIRKASIAQVSAVIGRAGYEGGNSVAANGYMLFTNGFKVQWGTYSQTANTDINVYFPTAFTSASSVSISGGSLSMSAQDNDPCVRQNLNSYFISHNASNDNISLIHWVAAGF